MGKLTDTINTLRATNLSAEEVIEALLKLDAPKPKKAAKRRTVVYTEAFEAFWKEYTPKGNSAKLTAFDEWELLTPDEQAQAHGALVAYGKTLKGKNAPSALHVVNYLKQRRFEGLAQNKRERAALFVPAELTQSTPHRFLAECRIDGASEHHVTRWARGGIEVQQHGKQTILIIDGPENEFTEHFRPTIRRFDASVWPRAFAEKQAAKRRARG